MKLNQDTTISQIPKNVNATQKAQWTELATTSVVNVLAKNGSLVTSVPNVLLSITDSPIAKLACAPLTVQKTTFATPTLVIVTAKLKPLVEITARNAQPDILDTPIVTVITTQIINNDFSCLSSFQNVFVMPKDQLMILAMMSLASALADPTLPV